MSISTFDRTHDKVVCMYVCMYVLLYSTESTLLSLSGVRTLVLSSSRSFWPTL